MDLTEIVDLLFVTSYFLISCCFVMIIMSEEVSRLPHKLKTRIFNRGAEKETSEDTAIMEHLHRPETLVERRQEALNYLVKNYFETKKREEEFTEKMERYGTVRRWIYRKSMNWKNTITFVTRTILKPSIMVLMIYSTVLSLYLGTRVGPEIAEFTRRYVPQPFNYVLDVLVIFPIGFSPGLLSIALNYYLEKKMLNKILQEYGVRT